jgi:hypothetical protein
MHLPVAIDIRARKCEARRGVTFVAAQEAPIQPLIPDLAFIIEWRVLTAAAMGPYSGEPLMRATTL